MQSCTRSCFKKLTIYLARAHEAEEGDGAVTKVAIQLETTAQLDRRNDDAAIGRVSSAPALTPETAATES